MSANEIYFICKFWLQILYNDLFSMGSAIWELSIRLFKEKSVLYGSTTTSEVLS